MLYRSIGEYKQYISRFGYACSTDGFTFERKNEIAFGPTEGYEKYGIEIRDWCQLIINYISHT